MKSAIRYLGTKLIFRLSRVFWFYRHKTSAFRGLPQTIIIGAQKAGTTSLFQYLIQHPKVIGSWYKEIHFFDGGLKADQDTFQRGLAWYRAHFPIEWRLRGGRQTLEASPMYLFNPEVPARIKSLLPGVKLIVILRDPVERALSQFYHAKRQGTEPLDLGEAMLAEERRLEPVLKKSQFRHPSFVHHSYKMRGLYADQLTRYFQLFDRNQLLILSSEELRRETQVTVSRAFAFMGLDPSIQLTDTQHHHKSQPKSEVPESVLDELQSYFQEPNQQLYHLLERDFGW